MVAVEVLVLEHNKAGGQFVGSGVDGREAPLLVRGKAGAKQRAVVGNNHSGVVVTKERARRGNEHNRQPEQKNSSKAGDNLRNRQLPQPFCRIRQSSVH